MYLCYLDESGVSDPSGNTSHYVLAGICIPACNWKECDAQINKWKERWELSGVEIHTAWILRPYFEQNKINDFKKLNYIDRRVEVNKLRRKDLLRLQNTNRKSYLQQKKNYLKTEPYIHLTIKERKKIIIELSKIVKGWDFARLFAECIDKIFFDPNKSSYSIDEQAFEQVVSRFEQFLQITSEGRSEINKGMLIHDNNETVSKKLTDLMIKFHEKGTFWTDITSIIETPLFVDSKLTSMVQIADLFSYSLRRYVENNETDFFNNIFKRADRKDGKVVGVRHFTDKKCKCKICSSR